jgi:hypothetical protein
VPKGVAAFKNAAVGVRGVLLLVASVASGKPVDGTVRVPDQLGFAPATVQDP